MLKNLSLTVLSRLQAAAAARKGATAIEYGLLAALIAVVIITAITAVGTNLSATFNKVANKLT